MNSLELRKKIKAKKPNFIRQNAGYRKRVKAIWRKPKGEHSKMRHRLSGKRKLIEPGYGSPKDVRGLHSTGLRMILIHSPKDLLLVDPKKDGIIISGTTGMKKAADIIREAKKKSVRVLNLKADDFVKKAEDAVKIRKEERLNRLKSKAEKKKEKPKAEKKEEKPVSEEEKIKQEKIEKEKVLTKKGGM